jgi:hypothetical protein
MSSVLSLASQAARPSPLELLQKELASEVSSGKVSASDQQALSSALNDIDSTLSTQAAQASKQASASSTPPSPADMQSKINSLIDGEVGKGTLTSAQASELKTVFANAFQAGGAGASADSAGTDSTAGGGGGPGGPRGAGGAAPSGGGAKKKTSADPADANGDGIVTAAEQEAYDAKHPGEALLKKLDSSSGSSATSELVSKFISLVQESQKDAQKGSASYSANGESLATQIQSLIVNYQA